MPSSNFSKKTFIKDKDGKFAGSLPSVQHVPTSVPQLPKHVNHELSAYEVMDNAAQERNRTSLEVCAQIDNALDALIEHDKGQKKQTQARLVKFEQDLEVVAAKLDESQKRLAEIRAKNAAELEELRRRANTPFARLVKTLQTIFR
jgi:septal ring factor EnvC (AmiA/AmiB activator)